MLYREHANQLLKENDQLQDMIRITEKDTIECFTLLQKKDEEKKNEVSCLDHLYGINTE